MGGYNKKFYIQNYIHQVIEKKIVFMCICITNCIQHTTINIKRSIINMLTLRIELKYSKIVLKYKNKQVNAIKVI